MGVEVEVTMNTKAAVAVTWTSADGVDSLERCLDRVRLILF